MLKTWISKIRWFHALIFIVAFFGTIVVLFLFLNIRQRKAEELQYPLMVVQIGENEIDPSIWGKNFPYEYDSFVKTEIDYGKT